MSAFSSWTGRVIDNDLPLSDYLGGATDTGVFRTTYSGSNAAIKLLAVDPATADAHLARLKEATKLSHPNLLRVLHFGRTQLDGTEFIYVVTEFADENLAQVLPDRALTTEEAQQVLQTSLDALAYLHQQGFAHADLKPANIMASNDQLKLSIDGIHRIGEPLSREAGPHDAPELHKDLHQAVSAASDVWSLGMTLVEILTQHLPAKAASDNSGPAVPESIPAPFREIAQHCLLRTPELRWTPADIANKLNPKAAAPVALTAPARVEAPRPVASVRPATPPRPGSKRPFVAIGIVAVIVGVIIAIPRLTDRKASSSVPVQTTSDTASQPVPEPKPEVNASQPPKAEPPTVSDTNSPATTSVESKPADPLPVATVPPQPSAKEPAPAVKHITDEPADDTASAPEPAPTEPSTQAGVVRQEMPNVIPQARRSISGKVRVKLRVTVDPSGNVVDSEFVSPGPSKYFSRSAMDAARRWKFAAAGTEARVWNLEFDFRRNGTDVHSAQQR